ncbi:MAG: orotidine-5'-phosphate decarboxylase [Burkholderiales bacterium]
MNPKLPRVFVALDFPTAADALALVERLSPRDCGLKVGKELFVTAGPELVRGLVDRGFAVFLDLKFHDIPNTVAGACAAATRLGVAMLNVHAGGGRAMMVAAREAVERASQGPRPLLIAVTVLTSLGDGDMRDLGIHATAQEHALRLAKLTQDCGLDGVVCSAQEAPVLRSACGPGFKLVTPGIRPADAAKDDQARILTPQAAVRNGADYLVIGRPITQAPDPVAVLTAINASIAS